MSDLKRNTGHLNTLQLTILSLLLITLTLAIARTANHISALLLFEKQHTLPIGSTGTSFLY